MYPCCERHTSAGTLEVKDERVVFDERGNASAVATMRVCPECGRRHFEVEAKPGSYGLTGTAL